MSLLRVFKGREVFYGGTSDKSQGIRASKFDAGVLFESYNTTLHQKNADYMNLVIDEILN